MSIYKITLDNQRSSLLEAFGRQFNRMDSGNEEFKNFVVKFAEECKSYMIKTAKSKNIEIDENDLDKFINKLEKKSETKKNYEVIIPRKIATLLDLYGDSDLDSTKMFIQAVLRKCGLKRGKQPKYLEDVSDAYYYKKNGDGIFLAIPVYSALEIDFVYAKNDDSAKENILESVKLV